MENFVVLSKRPLYPRLFLLSAAILSVLMLGHASGGIITAASPALVDVTAAVALAAPGDTVMIPAGTASWTGGLTIPNGITIQGATTVSGDHTTFNSTPMLANDQTIILDNIPRTGGLTPIFYFKHTAGTARVTGMTVKAGSVSGDGDGGVFLPSGSVMPPAQVRVDHCHLYRVNNKCMETIAGQVYGVMDHCLLDIDSTHQFFVFTMANWGGNGFGGAWAAPTGFGGPSFFFVEDCVVNNSIGAAQTVGCTDGYAGGKMVVRYCRFQNCVIVDHGVESGWLRSIRAREMYNNTIVFDRLNGSSGLLRGGTAVIHHNTFISSAPGSISGGITLEYFRSFYPFNAGYANGNSAWDLNQAGGLAASGTYSGSDVTSGGTGNLTITAGTWTAHQFAPAVGHIGDYMITNTTRTRTGWIVDNTATSITFFNFGQWDPNSDPLGSIYFKNGDTYQIYKVPTAGIDQPGRGQGNLIPDFSSATPAWPNQALEPIYSWNNTLNGNNVNIGSSTPTIIEGRDFFNNTPMPGYTPYTYPHPLIGGGTQPSPPTNLRVQ